jgi:hypothetical protein
LIATSNPGRVFKRTGGTLYNHPSAKKMKVTSANGGRIHAANKIAAAPATCAIMNAVRTDKRPLKTGASALRGLSESLSMSYTSLIASTAVLISGPQTTTLPIKDNVADVQAEEDWSQNP